MTVRALCLLPRPVGRGKGWGEGVSLVLARPSSPQPSPPLAGGEGEAAASCAGTSLIQRQWGKGEGAHVNSSAYPNPSARLRRCESGTSCRGAGHLLPRYPEVAPPPKLPATSGYLLATLDRKSTRLNSSHLVISYAAFCLKQM